VAPPVYFVRHGETEWNRLGLIQGWTDTPLNEKGHAQARAVATALMAIPGLARECRFVVSPLQRARQTMAHLAAALQVAAVAVDQAVKELGFGVWEGRAFRDLRTWPDYPGDPEARYAWRPEGGESYADGERRLSAWCAALDRPAVVVAHGAIGRCLIGHLCKFDAARTVALHMPQGSYCRLADGEAQWFDATGAAA
jgi:broad specificity phosphatase PhoE